MIMIAPWVIPAATAALGAFGAERRNRVDQNEAKKNRAFQADQAQTNRDFQERMRNTAWQASVADMEAAGLNPALAYSQGPAASPGGSMGSGSAPGAAADSVSSAMQLMQQRKALKLLDKQIAKTDSEAEKAEYEAQLSGGRVGWLNQQGRWEDWMKAELDGKNAQNRLMGAQARNYGAMADIAGPKAELFDFISDALGPALDFLRKQGGRIPNLRRNNR